MGVRLYYRYKKNNMISNTKRTILLSEPVVNAWLTNHEDKVHILEEELMKSSQLISLINEYQIGRYTARNVDFLVIESNDQNTGMINLNFVWEEYSGCKDLPNNSPSDLDVFFVIDFEKSLLYAEGEELRERDTVDEF